MWAFAVGSNHAVSWSDPGIRFWNCPCGKERLAVEGTRPVASMNWSARAAAQAAACAAGLDY
jgi:hypothetical protein